MLNPDSCTEILEFLNIISVAAKKWADYIKKPLCMRWIHVLPSSRLDAKTWFLCASVKSQVEHLSNS